MKAEYLSQEQKNEVKALLTSQLDAQSSLVASLSEKFTPPEIKALNHDKEHLSSHVLSQLKEVKRTLANIDSEDFGICERCHEPISWERLKAMPTATHCVWCATNIDRHLPVPKKNLGSLILCF